MKKILFTFLFVLVAFVGYGFNNNPKLTISTYSDVITNYSEIVNSIKYPLESRRMGVEGTVLVRFYIDGENKLIGYDIIKSPCCDLKEAVEEVINEFEFRNDINREDGIVSKTALLPIKFKLTI